MKHSNLFSLIMNFNLTNPPYSFDASSELLSLTFLVFKLTCVQINLTIKTFGKLAWSIQELLFPKLTVNLTETLKHNFQYCK